MEFEVKNIHPFDHQEHEFILLVDLLIVSTAQIIECQ
jgi:hypothetical protein